MTALSIQYPFTALKGVAQLQNALLLAAIDPLIGGVLIEGPRGAAKTTSARALAQLLPDGGFVNLPLGTSEEQLQGSLDIEAALKQGDACFKPGLLARAHQGVLYVDEVNLLPDALVDLLLDVSVSGVNRVERDGISHQHEARFVLVGTMNPEEGELRPQLLDRFGLLVRLNDMIDAPTRREIVRSRLAFEADPEAFIRTHETDQEALRERICQARARLESLAFTDGVHDRVSEVCFAAGVEGVRADLVMLRAARAHAALADAACIRDTDIDAVQALVLAHRRRDRSASSPDEASGPEPSGEDPSHAPETAGSSRSQGSGAGDHDAPRDTEATVPERGGHDQDWGALPPEPTPIRSLAQVRPLPTKKP
ncbi:magnesium chelatase [Ectothiorhodospira haloalkaliphila]|uniref:Magnesium chelatase n=2 Tax=Ectothiorhodospira haloalkaliphila TaxID=421628 RepID=W8KSB7_9GAMM|nr:AAA family ATPase [Ectothiorhodospira haloalkaliphila]AHK79912.1 magnesium chelatase [Ectothiorhodospira haloalkaliphila]